MTSLENYNDVKAEFEKSHFKVNTPIAFVRIHKKEISILSKKEIEILYGNLFCKVYCSKTERNLKKLFVTEWFKDATMRTYEKLDFIPPPLVCDDDVYNLYTGLRAETLPPTNNTFDVLEFQCKVILDHIFFLSGKNPEVYKYFIYWLAQIVQKTGILSRTALVIKSIQGAGKSMFFDFIGNKLLGKQYYFCTAKSTDSFGQFNHLLQNKLLNIINEASGKDTFAMIEQIKTQISDEIITIEQKFKNQYQVRNCGRYVFLTNNDNCLKVDPRERRLCCFESSSDTRKDLSYFDTLADTFENDTITRAFYEFLLQVDISKVHFEKDRPKTELYDSMNSVCIPTFAYYLNELIEGLFEETEKMSLETISKNYKSYLEKSNMSDNMNDIKLSKLLQTKYKIKKVKTGGTMKYFINRTELKETLKTLGYFVEDNENEITDVVVDTRPLFSSVNDEIISSIGTDLDISFN